MEKLKEAKKVCIVDRGFRMEDKSLEKSLCFPDLMDDKKTHEFKTRARLRQEIYNARLKYFSSLAQTFEYGFDRHKIVVHAVAVTVQYQMDCGNPIFEL